MPGVRSWRRNAMALVGLGTAYFAFPVSWSSPTPSVVVGLLVTAAGVALLVRMLVLELRNVRAGVSGLPVPVLSTILVVLVMSFSMSFFLVEVLAPGQFTGLVTRIDALYFTLSTMTTVGYGDVHAEGQLARTFVCALIVFNIVVVATLVRAHTRVGPPG